MSLLPSERLEQRLPDLKPRYSTVAARAEAERCLYCADAPCTQACPTEIDVPGFIKKIASDNVRGAARTIFDQNLLGTSCARVCPVEVLCVGACVYNGWEREPIQIGRLQRYATETATAADQRPLLTPKVLPAGARKRVALVGAGPASLACAGALSLAGHAAVIFEARALPGGLNTTGIAPYKLQAPDALAEVAWVQSLGVEVRTGVAVGESVTGAQLLADHDAVFLGLGLGADTPLGLPGEDGPGVVGATAWIERLKLSPAEPERGLPGRVVVIGGGNTAVDVARECALLGAAEVTLVYRRAEAAMSGYAHELAAARLAGVRLLPSAVPLAFVRAADGRLRGLRWSLGEDGQPRPGAESELACDLVVVAIGQSKRHALAAQFPGVTIDGRGCVVADAATGMTGNPKVFSGGDCVNGGKEVVNAVAEGRNAARALIRRWSA